MMDAGNFGEVRERIAVIIIRKRGFRHFYHSDVKPEKGKVCQKQLIEIPFRKRCKLIMVYASVSSILTLFWPGLAWLRHEDLVTEWTSIYNGVSYRAYHIPDFVL